VFSQDSNCANAGLNIAADLAGTQHFSGPARENATGNYYVVDQNGIPITDQGYLWNAAKLTTQGYLWNATKATTEGYLWNASKATTEGYLWNATKAAP
jgi:serine protease AprX